MGNRSQMETVTNPNYKSDAEPEPTQKPVQTTPSTTTKPLTSTTPTAPKEPEEEPSSGTALTPEGNMSLRDDINSALNLGHYPIFI